MIRRASHVIPLVALIAFVSLSCNLFTLGAATSVPATSAVSVDTAVAQTVAAQSAASTATAQAVPTEAVPPTATSLPTATSIPTDTAIPTETVTATPSGPMIHSTIDTNCRSGPGPGYEAVSFLLVKTGSVPLLGKSDSGGWWYIQDPRNSRSACWVWNQSTVAEGNVATLPIKAAPPFIKISTDKTSYNGSCAVAQTITVTGAVTSETSTSVQFHFETSTGLSSPTYTGNITAGDSFSKSYAFSFSSSSSGTIQAVISSPVNFNSNAISYTIVCGP
jgi:hypothetical protein